MAPPHITIWTIGHSTRPLADFIALLRANEIALLADVRRMPQSRRYPHFSREALERALTVEGIGYRHLEPLGGLRESTGDPANAGVRNGLLRGYADHMASRAFTAALESLMDAAQRQRVAIMCAEGDPKRCHRLLLSDALTARGWTVQHIRDDGTAGPRIEPHAMTPGARIQGVRVTYPAKQTGLDLGEAD